MSTDLHKTGHADSNEPRHSDVSYEKADVQVSSIYWYLLFLGLAAAASLALTIYILRYTSSFVSGLDAPMPASRAAMPTPTTMPPEPRLQGVPGHDSDPQQDMRDKLKADNAANETLGWVDQTNGVAQIPVKDAMKIIAENGMPGASSAPAENTK